MLFSGTYSWLKPVSAGGRIQNLTTAPNGNQEPADLVFGSNVSCSSPFNYETENYTSSTGAITDWVNVPSLSAGTVIYACYGNSGITSDHSNPSNTWNSNYNAIYHLPLTPPGVVSGSGGTAQFLKADTATEGSWVGAYGSDGYSVEGDNTSLPSYVSSVTEAGDSLYTWSGSTSNVPALQKPSNHSDRIAATWYNRWYGNIHDHYERWKLSPTCRIFFGL